MTSPVYLLSDDYINTVAELDPAAATYMGIAGHDHEMTDFSPAGHDARAQNDQRTLTQLNALDTSASSDRLAAGVLREALEISGAEYEANEHLASIRVIAGDVDAARSIFDLMPTDTAEQWAVIAERMSKVPQAFAGMRESWKLGLDRGVKAQRRQVLASSEQLATWAGRNDAPAFFEQFAESASSIAGAPMEQLRKAAKNASQALGKTADFLINDYAPQADTRDGVGPERHALARRRFMGMKVEAKDAYEWGWAEVQRIDAEMERVAQEILPGSTLNEVRHFLDTDPSRSIQGEGALRDWLQELMDDAMSFLIDNHHFSIPDSIRTVEAMISPPGGAAAMYYTGPSEDLSRPGRTWYPTNGRTLFPRWSEPTTAYHEGVPGHHLQVAIATINSEKLSRFQRNTFVSGHGEGWALYAERLMDEFGFLENPEYRLGYLYAQAFRAARVVIDIGIHCGFAIPQSSTFHPGEQWNPSLMFDFLSAHSSSDDEFNRSEINRYLGWPGQAISYKLGERVWLDLRDDAKQKYGAAFDLRKWHAHALDLGNLGLDLLKSEMARF
ncbi:MAG: hypothetical protein ABR57_06770 [Acidimicrobium sp. BACL17 MAG-120924-bin0]|nr:MAG: hypothetical protein ABR57_06770 [Acidimicrobium sp. BACL17 MAG-120924-bin0]